MFSLNRKALAEAVAISKADALSTESPLHSGPSNSVSIDTEHSPAKRRKIESTVLPFVENPAAWARLRRDCPHCQNESDPERKCVRVWEVEARSDIKTLVGCVISPADPDDRMEPKEHQVYGVVKKDTQKNAPVPFFTPDELELRVLEHRPDTYATCCFDGTILVDKKTQTQVGAIRFKAADKKTLQQLIAQNAAVVRDTDLNRSTAQQKWSHGNMTPIGSRSPIGGKRGDTYRPYDRVSVNNREDIKQLFEHAKAADTIASLIAPLDPDAAAAMWADYGTDALGGTSANLYSCCDYMSCCHRDVDGAPKKSNENLSQAVGGCMSYRRRCKADEFNFVYTKWGVLLCTVENCAWTFDSSCEHQVTLPRRSTYMAANTPLSQGDHPTVTTRNISKARTHRQARRLYSVITEYRQRLRNSAI
ncbi:hypothetical protein B0H10DRAFT_1984618 [Mycena sp. CBHHK59/15]|nr:hypothetical protein B0H10DRAFT_1984618 [Mycena sp. CBHHK59/15]